MQNNFLLLVCLFALILLLINIGIILTATKKLMTVFKRAEMWNVKLKNKKK